MRPLIAFMLLASACGKEAAPPRAKAGAPCSEHRDCEPELRCFAGACIRPLEAGAPCNARSRCADGLACAMARCGAPQAAGEQCESDRDCASGLLCLDGACRDLLTTRREVLGAVAAYVEIEAHCASADRLRRQIGSSQSGDGVRRKPPEDAALEEIKAAQLASADLSRTSALYAQALGRSCRKAFAEECPAPSLANPCAPATASDLTPRLRRLQERVSAWWLAGEAACPEGATLRGSEPPAGSAIWCEQPSGERTGHWTEWDENGTRTECTYLAGKRHGAYTVWGAHGGTLETGFYENGAKHGTWTTYDNRGKLLEQLRYEHGVLLEDEPAPR